MTIFIILFPNPIAILFNSSSVNSGNVITWNFDINFFPKFCLLLDEINLASQSVLQCIEEALDSEVISIEIPGFTLTIIKNSYCYSKSK